MKKYLGMYILMIYNCKNQMYNNSEPNVHKIAKNR
ncbi:hypothetical protein GGR21_000794 [Dysgonomonas hofstadii]|uniref:Uncharacterized protein n=1 Tax=Dysgonomonas hofstadii TaxID=637886 RepID=A0A840CFZ0_9BACT|nr:hypothetical protein [Dysgonomonas hofstadii]